MVVFLYSCNNEKKPSGPKRNSNKNMILEGCYNVSESKLDKSLEQAYFSVFNSFDYRFSRDTIFEYDYYSSDDSKPLITRYLRKKNPVTAQDKRHLLRLDSNRTGNSGYVRNFEISRSHDYYIVRNYFAPASFILVYKIVKK
jgi:hypothetical protein